MNTHYLVSVEVGTLKQQNTLGGMWFSCYNQITKVL